MGFLKLETYGIQNATGKYISFIDADDYIEPDMIMSLYNTIKQKKVDVVRGNYYIGNKKANKIKANTYGLSNQLLNKADIENKLIPNLLESKLQCYVWLLLIPLDKLKEIGGFDKELYILEDTVFYLNLLMKANNIYILEKPLYHYNVMNISSATKSEKYYIRNMKNMIVVNKKIKEVLYKDENTINNEIIEIIDTRHLTCIINYVYLIYKSQKNLKKAIEQFDKIRYDAQIQDMIKNYNKKYINIKQNFENKLVLKKHYNILKIFYSIKILLRKLNNK